MSQMNPTEVLHNTAYSLLSSTTLHSRSLPLNFIKHLYPKQMEKRSFQHEFFFVIFGSFYLHKQKQMFGINKLKTFSIIRP